MRNFYKSSLYIEDIQYVAKLELPWEKLHNKSIIISGATGLIGSFLVDVIMLKNQNGLNCSIYALSRNVEQASKRFVEWIDSTYLKFVACNIQYPLHIDDIRTVDYVLHMASNTHPVLYATDPIGTIATNIIGVQNMLDFAVSHNAKRFAFTSSNEIYGENRGDVELFDEDYCGYINCNTIRAGYPESKRCGEALCQAYKAQKGLNVVLPRVTRTYGPTMSMNDTKAISQFLRKGIAREDIVLKSEGAQLYSYTYVADAVAGVLYVMLCGENGEAYNIADVQSDITLKDLATLIANITGTKVVYNVPDEIEAAGYSKATKARLDGKKLKTLGWNMKYSINRGIERTLKILSEDA